MPIGVPKVAYRLPGEAVPQWVDLYNRLYRERVLFLGSTLDDELANQLNGIMLYLSQEDATRRLFMYVNSLGGGVTAGLSVADIMNYVGADVTTIGLGFTASMASFVLGNGQRGNRVLLVHCRVMIHQPQAGLNGQAGDVMLERAELIRLRKLVGVLYIDLTGQMKWVVERDLDRDTYMNALESRKYGIIDVVNASEPEITRLYGEDGALRLKPNPYRWQTVTNQQGQLRKMG
jgi:ATP-dependent Clp protease protease subunit